MIQTACRFCEFRVNDETGKQIGCELGIDKRLDGRYNTPLATVQYDDEHGKDESEVVPGFCLFRRTKGWKEAKKEQLTTLGDFKSIARSELRLKTTVIAYLAPGDTIETAKSFLKNINELSVKPQQVVLINRAGIKPILFLGLEKGEVPWTMEFVLEPLTNESDVDMRRGYDIGSKKASSSYIVTMKAGERLDVDYLKKIEDGIIENLESFIAIIPNTPDKPAFYQTAVYKFVKGNYGMAVEQKIIEECEAQECQYLVKRV